MSFDYDLFVIGAGSGGVRAARMAASSGILANGKKPKVAIAEKSALGGTCVNVGCVPKKLMVYASHVHDELADAKDYGWNVDTEATLDWPCFIQKKNQEIKRLNDIYGNLLRSAGVEILEGHARLIDEHTVEVGGKKYSTKKVLLAVGGKPVKPDIPGSEHTIVSDDVFYLAEQPKRIVIVGGGYIALEFAGIFKGLGSEVDVVYRGNQLLRHFEHDLGSKLLEQSQLQGIRFHLGKNIKSVEKTADYLSSQLDNGEILHSDAVFYATGRSSLLDELGLDRLGIEVDAKNMLVVNEQFQTNIPSIYALGDIIGTPQLTPVALEQAMVFVDQQYGEKKKTISYEAIPTAIFTQPNLATVGLSEHQALALGLNIDVYQSDFKHLKHTLTSSINRVYMKLVVEQGSDKVLGVHMMGPDAGEIIQGLALAVKCELTKSQLDSVIGIHPTAAEEFVTMRQRAYSKP